VNYWPADPVSYNLRLLPVIASFSANYTEIVDGATLHDIEETLRVVALDSDGVSQAQFFIAPSGSSNFTSLGLDTDPTDGLSADLALDAFPSGAYDLKVVVQTASGYSNQTVRHVKLQLGAPPPPMLSAPVDGSHTNAPSVTVSGVTSRGTTVSILRNGVPVAGSLNAPGDAFSASIPLLPGANVLTARATNSVGTSGDSAAVTVTLGSLLTVTINPPALKQGASGTITVSRNQSQGTVQVALSASLAGQLAFPATLSLAAGATQTSASISAINNNLPGPDQTVTITASAAGYMNGSAPVTVQNINRTNLPDLIVTGVSAPAQALPGAQIEVDYTVKNQGMGPAPAGWTDLIYFSDDHVIGNDHLAGSFVAPAALAAGQSIARRVPVTVPSIGAGAKYLVVQANGGEEDFESDFTNNSAIAANTTTIQAVLSLELAKTSAPKNSSGITATLMRNGDTTGALTVALSASPTALVMLPATVTIPASAASTTFTVLPIENNMPTGNQNVTITAHAATGYVDGTSSLQIIDDDAPTLTVSITPSSVPETATSPAAMGTVQCNATLTAPLTVGLLSGNTGAATVPLTVTIPAGSTSVSFPISVIDDMIVTPTRTVRITAAATGFATGSALLDVTDADVPALSLQLAPSPRMPAIRQLPATSSLRRRRFRMS
jgi:hypothetical protein